MVGRSERKWARIGKMVAGMGAGKIEYFERDALYAGLRKLSRQPIDVYN